jgi:hypothetical protein
VIYFLQAESGGPIKIGFSRDEDSLKSRVRHLQTSQPVKLVVRKTIEGTHEDEQALHKQFHSSRLVGEWFVPTVEIARLSDAKPGPHPNVTSPQEAYDLGLNAGLESADFNRTTEIRRALKQEREAQPKEIQKTRKMLRYAFRSLEQMDEYRRKYQCESCERDEWNHNVEVLNEVFESKVAA